MTLLLFSVVFRVVSIQYVDGDKYRKVSDDLSRKLFDVKANKGSIYSINGDLLATSSWKFTIHMDVMSVNSTVFERDVKVLSDSLSGLLKTSSSKYYEQKLRRARKLKNRYIPIAKNLDYNDYIRLKQFPIFKYGPYKGGLIAKQNTGRVRFMDKVAERTIGYSDHRGDAGIEGAFSEHIKGVDGSVLMERRGKGQWRPVKTENEKEPIDGFDVITTLDINMQDITHHALLKQLEYFEADHGCAVVMETATGEIRAISNLGRTKEGKYYEKRNYAVWESHEPGSTFKLASLMAALDDKVIDTSTVVDTEKGKIFIHGKKVEDSERGGYGKISAARAFEVSSNVGIVKLIRKHYDNNPEKFVKHLEDYRLTQPIGLKIKGEGIPKVPHPKEKGWNKISLEWMSWGYGVSVTPLQTLMVYNAVANDGKMVKPRFIRELRKENITRKRYKTEVLNEQIASPETIRKLKKVMEDAVVKGTADNIYTPNFSMAGKTGTAKKYIPRHIDKKGNTIPGGYSGKHYVASFAGFFPVEQPKYSCIVVIHDPDKKKGYYGAIVAAPVFKEIAQKIYTSIPVESDAVPNHFDSKWIRDNNGKKSIDDKKVPNVKGMTAMDAISLLENVGLKVQVKGIGKVKKQSIKRGTPVERGATIILNLS